MKRHKWTGRIPKSDDVNSFWNYGMTEEEVAAYLQKKRNRRERDNPPEPTLIAAE